MAKSVESADKGFPVMEATIDLKERLSFLRLDSEAIAILKSLKPLADKVLPNVLRDFYKHIGKHASIARFFQNDSSIDFAAKRQASHWSTILEGHFSNDYMKSVRQIGEVHARIGLEPQYYLAGYTFILDETLKLISNDLSVKGGLPKKQLEQFNRFKSVFIRAAMLDMDLAIHFFNEVRAREAKQRMLDLAKIFETNVGGITQVVASASSELENTAQSMSSIADQTSEKSLSVAASVTQASDSVATAARSADELGKSVTEISSRMSHASQMASQAVGTATETNTTIQSLSESAQKVSQVIKLISDIASQTNLLALNATIESARAGEAGKGFAVVASEVKSLANQTAKATEDITLQIQNMQELTLRSVEAISQISSTIEQMNSVTLSINAAVEEQAASTKEIARSTHEAARGTEDVRKSITDVSNGAEGTKAASGEVVLASKELERQAVELTKQVSEFLETIRAA